MGGSGPGRECPWDRDFVEAVLLCSHAHACWSSLARRQDVPVNDAVVLVEEDEGGRGMVV